MARVGDQGERARDQAAGELHGHERRGQQECDAEHPAAAALAVRVFMMVPMPMRSTRPVVVPVSPAAIAWSVRVMGHGRENKKRAGERLSTPLLLAYEQRSSSVSARRHVF